MKFDELLARIYEIQDLRKAARILTWDREVNMPILGNDERINQISTLQRLSHELYASDETGELIEAAAQELNGVPYRSKEASLIRFLRRDYADARKLSPHFVSQLSRVKNEANRFWKEARLQGDFEIFRPYLEDVIRLQREMAERFGYQYEPYDALLNRYEPQTTAAEVRSIFTALKADLIPLIQLINNTGNEIDDSFLHQTFPIAAQKEFAHYLAESVGYDFRRGHLATAVHPFSTSFSTNDVRITTRYNPLFLGTSIFATLHEAGHAIYVQNVDPALTRTPLAKETSAGLDESQSRLIENIVGRSRGFWARHLPKLKAYFPHQLGDVNLEDFYRAVNRVKPEAIRVEADELAYNLHIIIRFELEQALLYDQLLAADLPEAWNEKMTAMLGIAPVQGSLDCLQDIHWTMVGFGYFPTYTLGNLYAAQFFETAVRQSPNILGELASGEIDTLGGWLKENIHQYGRKLTPKEISFNATGKPLGHEAFVRYVSEKYTDVYGLSSIN